MDIYQYTIVHNKTGVMRLLAENGSPIDVSDKDLAKYYQRYVLSNKDNGGFEKLSELHPDRRLLVHYAKAQNNNNDEKNLIEKVVEKLSVDAADNTNTSNDTNDGAKKTSLDPKMINVVTGIGIALAFVGITVAIIKK